MSTAVTELPLTGNDAAARLRRTAAAVRVQFTWWGVQRTLTSEQKEEVSDTYGADARLLSAGKKIIDVRHEAFKKLTGLRSRIVRYWRALTLPYVESGVRLIRQADIESFVPAMEGFRDELAAAEADLDRAFAQLKADARKRLGRLYNPGDYPAEVQGLFGVAWDFPAVEPPAYLLRLSPEVYRQEQERVAHRFEEAVRLAEQAFAGEFAKLVSHLTERLADSKDGERRVFRDSVVSNLVEFFSRFQRLNLSSNQELDQLVAQAQGLVQGVTPQALRDDQNLRHTIATRLTQVQTQLDGMLVAQPRRRLIRPTSSRNGASHATAG